MGRARRGASNATNGGGRYYEIPGAFGAQQSSARASVAAFSIGRSSGGSKVGGSANPGPGHYTHSSSFGRQDVSGKQSSCAFSLGASNARTSNAGKVANDVPYYDHKSAFGSQSASGKHSGRASSMSGWNGKRGDEACGPNKYYDTDGAFGAQHASSRQSNPSFSLGKTDRSGGGEVHRRDATGTPGPGHYFSAEAGEAYSDMTRYSGLSIAKGSRKWARDVGRSSSATRMAEEGIVEGLAY